MKQTKCSRPLATNDADAAWGAAAAAIDVF